MNEPELVKPFRIAFRAEGNMVNCYLALTDTMEGAMLIGSVMKSILNVGPEQFERYRAMMEAGIAAAIKETLGVDVHHFDIERAPEHERSGNS